MPSDPWTSERVELLKELWAAGATANAIAERLGGLSRSAVLGKVFRLRLGIAEAAPPIATDGPRRTRVNGAGPACRTDTDADTIALPGAPVRRRKGKRSNAPARSRVAARARGKSLLELTNNCCRWPYGRPDRPNFFFCGASGADLEHGMPYCARHARRAYCVMRKSQRGAVPVAVHLAPFAFFAHDPYVKAMGRLAGVDERDIHLAFEDVWAVRVKGFQLVRMDCEQVRFP